MTRTASRLVAPARFSKPISRHLVRDWWERAEEEAKLEPVEGRGWHSLRRTFASELMHQPLKVVCALGGWRDPQTVLKCYQRPDEAELRQALDRRKAAVAGAESREWTAGTARLRRRKSPAQGRNSSGATISSHAPDRMELAALARLGRRAQGASRLTSPGLGSNL